MDPNANLSEQRKIARDLTAIQDCDSNDGDITLKQFEEVVTKAFRLAELVIALDEWRTKGADWAETRENNGDQNRDSVQWIEVDGRRQRHHRNAVNRAGGS